MERRRTRERRNELWVGTQQDEDINIVVSQVQLRPDGHFHTEVVDAPITLSGGGRGGRSEAESGEAGTAFGLRYGGRDRRHRSDGGRRRGRSSSRRLSDRSGLTGQDRRID